MKKGDLKNLLRRRTADKLYDLARSAGHAPAHVPGVVGTDSARESARRTRARAKRPLGGGPAVGSRG